jgi:hypothetical protein
MSHEFDRNSNLQGVDRYYGGGDRGLDSACRTFGVDGQFLPQRARGVP